MNVYENDSLYYPARFWLVVRDFLFVCVITDWWLVLDRIWKMTWQDDVAGWRGKMTWQDDEAVWGGRQDDVAGRHGILGVISGRIGLGVTK